MRSTCVHSNTRGEYIIFFGVFGPVLTKLNRSYIYCKLVCLSKGLFLNGTEILSTGSSWSQVLLLTLKSDEDESRAVMLLAAGGATTLLSAVHMVAFVVLPSSGEILPMEQQLTPLAPPGVESARLPDSKPPKGPLTLIRLMAGSEWISLDVWLFRWRNRAWVDSFWADRLFGLIMAAAPPDGEIKLGSAPPEPPAITNGPAPFPFPER